MKKTKKEMEIEIVALVKEMREEGIGSAGYDAIFQNLRGKLFEYACDVRGTGSDRYISNALCAETYTVEILKVIDDSLKYFKEERGDFIHYFNFNVSRSIKQAKGKDMFVQSHGGAGLSRKKVNAIKKYKQLAEDRQLDPEDESLADLRKAMKISDEDLRFYRSNTYSLDYTDEDNPKACCEEDEESAAEEGGSDFVDILERVNSAFLKTPGRTDVLSKLLTANLAEEIHGWNLEKTASKMDFFDRETYELYLERGKKEQQNEVAERCGMKPEQLNRTYNKRFKKILKSEGRKC